MVSNSSTGMKILLTSAANNSTSASASVNISNHYLPSGGSRGGKGGASVPPFGLHLTLRSTDDKLNGTPLSGYRSKKTAAMAHLRML